jgi:cytidyltransferase-like protein
MEKEERKHSTSDFRHHEFPCILQSQSEIIMARKKVFVSGCFDMLHSGHVRFFEEAATYGDVYVGLGSDRTVMELKGRPPLNTETERKYMISALKHVKACYVNSGSGIMDFLGELKRVSPDVFVVNEDGNIPAKSDLCKKLGIRYVVLKRNPFANLPPRSTTSLRRECHIPYRLDLAGGWLDQPFVSKFAAGPVLTICVEPTMEFNERSGMASSSRRRAIELWQTDIPVGDRAKLAKVLFSYENPPGTTEFSGSQDSLGIVFPGLNRFEYRGTYWPSKINSVLDEQTLRWIENHLQLVPLGPRKSGYRVLSGTKITTPRARALADAADACWDAILKRDLKSFGKHFRESFEAQIAMFPNMVNPDVRATIRKYSDKALGWKLSGAGGGGYLVLVTEMELPGTIKIRIRRAD